MLLLAAALMFAPARSTAMTTTQYLYHQCKAAVRGDDNRDSVPYDPLEFAGCYGYIEGIVDGMLLTHNHPACPQEASLTTLIHVYVAYIDADPRRLDGAKDVGVILALSKAYPCPAK